MINENKFKKKTIASNIIKVFKWVDDYCDIIILTTTTKTNYIHLNK